MEKRKITRALISVSDKDGLPELAQALHRHEIAMLSTGGTAGAIRDIAKCPVTEVSTFTGSPEVMDGRVKTLDPAVFGGILCRRDKHEDWHALGWLHSYLIDLVVVNLYPFAKKLADGADHDTLIENIDIGGPSMVRAAAKNYKDVVVITSPSQYQQLITMLDSFDGQTDLEFRVQCFAAAYQYTKEYEVAVATYARRYANGGV